MRLNLLTHSDRLHFSISVRMSYSFALLGGSQVHFSFEADTDPALRGTCRDIIAFNSAAQELLGTRPGIVF
jgi:hypothetical protein